MALPKVTSRGGPRPETLFTPDDTSRLTGAKTHRQDEMTADPTCQVPVRSKTAIPQSRPARSFTEKVVKSPTATDTSSGQDAILAAVERESKGRNVLLEFHPLAYACTITFLKLCELQTHTVQLQTPVHFHHQVASKVNSVAKRFILNQRSRLPVWQVFLDHISTPQV